MGEAGVNKIVEKHFDNRDVLDEALANTVARQLQSAIEQHRSAVLCVSGGSTPLNLFRLLSEKDIPWNQVIITLADERWVPPDHRDSNHKLVAENLLVNQAADAIFVPLYNGASTASEGVAACYERLCELGQIDVLILGMGDDGHTASLFPHADALPEALKKQSRRSCIAVQPKTAPHERISLTLSRLLNSQEIILHIVGDTKMDVLKLALREEDPTTFPVSAVLNQAPTPVEVYWSR